MAGTRYIVANYLKVLGLEPNDIKLLIGFLVEQTGYPSIDVIVEFLRSVGLQCDKSYIDKSRVFAIDSIVIGTFYSSDTAYVLILHSYPDNVIYLNASGEMNSESYESFRSAWSGIILSVSVPSYQEVKARLTQLEDHKITQEMAYPTIKQLKMVRLAGEPPVYKICRHFSIYLSYLFVRLRIPPNAITFSWLFPILAAAYLFTRGNSLLIRITAVMLIFLGYTLDCSDGEVARITKKFSRAGGYIDSLIHWISSPALILGVTIGLFRLKGEPVILIKGLFCLFGDTLYNYLAVQLTVWRKQNSIYDIFHPIMLPLSWLFPIGINLIIIGSIFNCLPAVLNSWAYLSLILSLITIALFFISEAYNSFQK